MSGVSGAALYIAMSQAGLSDSTIFFTQVHLQPAHLWHAHRVMVVLPSQVISAPLYLLVFMWVRCNEPSAFPVR
jgi:hypothetical protein